MAASGVAATFAATAFLVPVVADRFSVSLGAAGLISVCQVGGFTATTLIAGRRFRPGRHVLVAAALAQVAANLISAATPWWWLLLTSRLLAGIGLGLVTWLAWIDAMRERQVMKDVAGVGPLTALAAAPLFGLLAVQWGDRPIFILLAIAAAVPLGFRVRFEGLAATKRRLRMSPSRSNLVLLVALAFITLAGSSMWVFTAAMAERRIGLSLAGASLAFSVNAGAGLIATRLRARPGSAHLWVAGIAGAVAAMVWVPSAAVFYAAMAAWGFCFWMAIPEVLRQVASWSLVPEERVGDAQGLMALGRMAGPALGGLLVGTGSFIVLGIEAAAGTLLAAVLIGGVERYRRQRTGPAALDHPGQAAP